jgi:succinate dehydrogenase / fumarate reductase cytochrome b subunit
MRATYTLPLPIDDPGKRLLDTLNCAGGRSIQLGNISKQGTASAQATSMMNLPSRIFNSSVGKKYIMAVSGAAMFLFVVGHLLGNLQVFLGPEKLNAYGHFLQTNIELIWAARLGLLAMLVLHVWSAIRLTAENRAARPIAYANPLPPVAASYASRTMMMSGLIVFVFIIYHLLHFTVQVPAVNLVGTDFRNLQDAGRHDIYQMMIRGFRHPLVAGFYILGVALLALHLSHGIQALFQSLGWKKKSYGGFLSVAAKVAAVLIFLGYASIPLSILLGLIGK